MQKKEPRYEDGTEYWWCSKCGQWLLRTKYYLDKRSGNGLKAQCKKCHTVGAIKTCNPDNARRINREYMARARKGNPERFRQRERNRPPASPEKILARSTLNGAVKGGKLAKPERCPKCGSEGKIEGHHPDYEKPLEVGWVCPLCHAEIHRDLGVIF